MVKRTFHGGPWNNETLCVQGSGTCPAFCKKTASGGCTCPVVITQPDPVSNTPPASAPAAASATSAPSTLAGLYNAAIGGALPGGAGGPGSPLAPVVIPVAGSSSWIKWGALALVVLVGVILWRKRRRK